MVVLRLCDTQIFLQSRYTSRYGKNIAIHESIHDTKRLQKYHNTQVDGMGGEEEGEEAVKVKMWWQIQI